jgi:hypothetical protein
MRLLGRAIRAGAPPAAPSVAPPGGVEQCAANFWERAKRTPLAYDFAGAGAAGQ